MSGANAVDKYMIACEKGDMYGCYQAGVVYWTGEGARKDREAARSLLEIACDGGVSDACVALRTFNTEENGAGNIGTEVPPPKHKKSRYKGHIDGKLYGDIDNDGKLEIIAWKKFASVDLGDYYQLLVIDDDGSLLWKGPKEKDESNPYVFSYLDTGLSLPVLLADIDNDGYMELLALEPQSDVRPTYYRKLRWRGTYFEPLLSNALILSSTDSNRFVWKTTSKSYATWISKLAPYRDSLVKADVTQYNKDESVRMGVALIKFDREGAIVSRWIKPITSPMHIAPAAHKTMGLVHGLDPHGDGFLSIRRKPNKTEIGRLYNGDKVEILGRSGKWYKIKDPRTGRIGWSYGKWIRIDY
ncbi:SH3 domain-containing protein [Sulfurovum sp.]|uniref:SH3 domain-containing protein n=1 Tax=Sulfurovum sp. TaxID=1969726 RepID=UPI0025F30CD2|nr:SH3 domain-containing protein [Sulfurovum sp.]